jgi:hypothetical protein
VTVGDRRGLIFAVAGLTVGIVSLLAITGPTVEQEVASSVRRTGGVCLELERWTLMGWSAVGQTHTVRDMQSSSWQPPVADPPCASVPERDYLVRVFEQPPGVYRLCGLADDNGCVDFRRAAP